MLDTAISIACDAGEVALMSRDLASPDVKHDGTWVTETDRALEVDIRRGLYEAFPAHHVCGEEEGGRESFGDGYHWVVDPLDGTVNYVMGLPIWGVSIGLLHDGELVLGVVYLPELEKLFAAERGSGATLDRMPIQPDMRGVMDQNSLVAFNSDALQDLRIETPAMLRNLGSAAAHGCYVASGGVTAAVFHKWRTWDLAAALCIAFEAGAICRYLDGTPLTSLAHMAPLGIGEPMVLGPEYAVEELVRGVALRSA